MLSCRQHINDWQKVEVLDDASCADRKTECTTNHQGVHVLSYCLTYFYQDTLHIYFPPEYPAYTLDAEIRVAGGMYKAFISSIPFTSDETPFYEITGQKLLLNKAEFNVGDTLQGYVELEFKDISINNSQDEKLFFKGYIYKIVRPEVYFKFEDEEAIMSYDLDFAVNELGEPLGEELFTTCCLPEFRVELLNVFPSSDSIFIRELTWNTSNDAQISDAGIHRLTIWYAQQDGIWQPVQFLKWNTLMQF